MAENKQNKMQKEFDKLRELQHILLNEFEIEEELDEIPQELNELKRQFHKLERTIAEKEASRDHKTKRLEQLTKEKEEFSLNKEKYEGQIKLIKTQKEYEALTSEIAQIDEKLSEIESEELDSLQQVETLNSDLEEQTAQLKEMKTTIAGKEKEVNKLTLDKQKELDKYLKEKKTTATGLDKELIYKFEKIVKNKDGIGIISIKNNVCMGCNVLLPHQFVNDVRREDKILFCPNCSRILYYQHEELAEEIAFQP
jgi:predicted  nucleic acid-binding Zn-ribbon protein